MRILTFEGENPENTEVRILTSSKKESENFRGRGGEKKESVSVNPLSWSSKIEQGVGLPTVEDKEQLRKFKDALRGWYRESLSTTSKDKSIKRNNERYLSGKTYLESLGYSIKERPGLKKLSIVFQDTNLYDSEGNVIMEEDLSNATGVTTGWMEVED